MAYRTFTRSANNFEEFAKARKRTVETGLTRQEALQRCEEYDKNRTSRQIRKGTKLEFEEQ